MMRAWIFRRSALAAAAACWLAACVSPPPTPIVLYRLPLDAAGAPVTAPAVVGPTVLLEDPRLPAYLDRDRLLLAVGDTAAAPVSRARWAEPLRDAVPRVLRRDLAQRLGADRVAGPTVPQGLTITHRVRVEIEALDVTPDHRGVRLAATWWVLPDPPGGAAARAYQVAFTTPAPSAALDDLVLAHREALRRLADRIADGLNAPGATALRP